jgi:hypothetical protein
MFTVIFWRKLSNKNVGLHIVDIRRNPRQSHCTYQILAYIYIHELISKFGGILRKQKVNLLSKIPINFVTNNKYIY